MLFSHIYNAWDTYKASVKSNLLITFQVIDIQFNDFYTRSLEGAFVEVNLLIHYPTGGSDISKLDCLTSEPTGGHPS